MRGYGPSSYGDGFADIYDDWYDNGAEIDVIVAAVVSMAADRPGTAPAPVVLELGIGTGRLALPLAAAGLDVRGIDASRAMVERMEAKPGAPVPVHIGNFADVVVPSAPGDADGVTPPADMVLCADNALFNLTTETDQRRCLAGVAAALRPEGILIVEAFVPPDADQAGTESDRVHVRSLAIDRVVLTAAVHDPTAQTMAGQYIDITDGGVRLRPWSVRYLYPAQLDALAADAGLVLVSRWADWAGAAFHDGADHHVSVYRRTADG